MGMKPLLRTRNVYVTSTCTRCRNKSAKNLKDCTGTCTSSNAQPLLYLYELTITYKHNYSTKHAHYTAIPINY